MAFKKINREEFPVMVEVQSNETYFLSPKKMIPNQKKDDNNKRHSVVNSSK